MSSANNEMIMLHPLSPVKLIIYLLFGFAVAFFGIYLGMVKSNVWGIAFWIGGLFLWTLAEYLIHRFFFHPWGRIGKSRLFMCLLADHGRHHRFPEEMATGFWNPAFGLPFLLTIGALFYSVLGGYAFPVLSGFTLGYIGYILVHHSIHRSRPPFAWTAVLWRHHFFHHFHRPDKCFGVTTLFWDRIFGTRVGDQEGRTGKNPPSPGEGKPKRSDNGRRRLR